MESHAPLFVLLWWFFFSTPAQSQSLPGGYISLFNGIDLQGWSIQWPGLWWVEDGVLYGKQDPTSLTLPGSRGDSWLYTTSEWDDFALSLRFRITSNGNSGIGFRVPAGIEGRPSQYGYEMQIWKEDPEYPTGSIYLHTKATKNLHRDKEWNQVELTAVGNHVTVFLNREKVVDARLSGSLQGRIGLQIHGGTPKPDQLVAFQSIQIKDLKPQTLAAPSPITFQAMQISSLPSEGAAVADLNRDGWPDITCGPVWYEGPSWIPHTYRTVTMLGEIMDNSHEIPLDVNQDGWVDLITGGWYSGTLTWWENPGLLQEDRLWQSHLIAE
ncbi:MAG: DUF1080 domain-containing protein, partial [Candidatus Omnitrophica bacterium]|nr:DUF1080 domain-containing protein [Candidatus Omnitrophota bacterium]